MTTLLESKLNIIKSSYVPVAGDKSKVIAKNWLPNPNFENSVTDWSTNGNASIARSTVDKSSGSASMLLTSISTGTFYTFKTAVINVKEGDIVTFKVKLKAASTVNTFNLLFFTYLDGANVGNLSGIASDDSNTSWTEYILTNIIPAGINQIRPGILCATGVASQSHYIDDCILLINENVTFFDGTTANAYWEGATNLSPSILTDPANTPADDLLFNYWANKSGLTPRDSFSMGDHVRAAGSHDFIKDVT